MIYSYDKGEIQGVYICFNAPEIYECISKT